MTQTCPICKQAALAADPLPCRDYLGGRAFTLYRCAACGCGHTEIPPDTPGLGTYYGQDYYGSKTGKFSFFLEKIFQFNHKRNARFFYKKFKPQRILEIGCGRAYILRELKSLGCRPYCLESADAAEWILNNPGVQVAALAEGQKRWPFADDYFQLVILWHVFEHLPLPAEALREITRVLQPGHTLCISVPNFGSFQARITGKLWFHLDAPRHLYHFSKTGLTGLLQEHGYEISETVSGDAMQNLYGWLQSLANLVTPGTPNSLYRFLQGGIPWRNAPRKHLLLLQLLTAPLWGTLAICGWLAEELTGNQGTITVYARKPK